MTSQDRANELTLAQTYVFHYTLQLKRSSAVLSFVIRNCLGMLLKCYNIRRYRAMYQLNMQKRTCQPFDPDFQICFSSISNMK